MTLKESTNVDKLAINQKKQIDLWYLHESRIRFVTIVEQVCNNEKNLISSFNLRIGTSRCEL